MGVAPGGFCDRIGVSGVDPMTVAHKGTGDLVAGLFTVGMVMVVGSRRVVAMRFDLSRAVSVCLSICCCCRAWDAERASS